MRHPPPIKPPALRDRIVKLLRNSPGGLTVKQISCWNCPVALAVKRAIGEDPDLGRDRGERFNVEVSHYILVESAKCKDSRRWSIPEVRRFEHLFDKDEAVNPFSFEMEGLEEFIARNDDDE